MKGDTTGVANSKECCDMEEKWKSEEAVRTIKNYEKLKKDKKLWNSAMKMIEDEIKEYQSLLKSQK